MLSGLDTINNLFRHQSVDHVPFFDSPWGDTLRRWVKEGYPTDDKGNPVSPTDHFGFDFQGVGGWFDILPKAGVSEMVEETDEWKLVRNGAGAVLKWWKHKSGTPEHVDFHMTTRDVWEKEYRPFIVAAGRDRAGGVKDIQPAIDAAHAKGRWAQFGHMFIWENMRQSMGDMALYTALLDDPQWIHDYNRVYTDFFKRVYKILIEEGGKPDGVWMYEDLGYKDRLFCSPTTLEELIFPYFKELVDFFHGYGLPVVLHSCGFTEPALPLIVQAGFDGLNPMEVKAGNNLFRIAEQYGDKLVFFGGFDARILETGDRAAIHKGVTDFMTGMKKRNARFVFASDHSLSTNIAYKDFQYALEVYEENRMW